MLWGRSRHGILLLELEFSWGHRSILHGAGAAQIITAPHPCFQDLHKTGMDARPLAIGCPLANLIKLKDKEYQKKSSIETKKSNVESVKKCGLDTPRL